MDEARSHAGRNDNNNMFEEILKINAALLVADVISIKETTNKLKDAMENIQVRLRDAEQQISDIEDTNARMEKGMKKCNKTLETLWTRVEDLENRSWRNNVRLVGLKEGKEEVDKVIQYVEKNIFQGLGLTGNEFEIERAYCSRSHAQP